MVNRKSISDFLKYNRIIIIFLAVLLFIIYSFMVYQIFNKTYENMNNIFSSNCNLIEDYISFRLEKKMFRISNLPLSVLTNILKTHSDIYSWQRVNNKGEVVYSFPDSSLVGISYSNLEIFNDVLEKGEDQIKIESHGDNNKMSLVLAHKSSTGINIGVFSFEDILKEISQRNEFYLHGDGRGNIILTNKSDFLNFSSSFFEKGDEFFSLSEMVYVISRELKPLKLNIYFIYDVRGIILPIIFPALIMLGIIFFLYWIFTYLRRNFKNVIREISMLEDTSKNLTKILHDNKQIFKKVNNVNHVDKMIVNTIEGKEASFKEIDYVFKSYYEMLDELVLLIQEVSSQNEEISAMNEEVCKSYEELEDYQGKILTIVDFLGNMDPTRPLKEFMEEILDMALTLIPSADAGSVGITENGYYKFLAQHGYSSVLTDTSFPLDIIIPFSEKPKVYKETHNKFNLNQKNKYSKLFEKAGSGRIKSSLAIGLKTDKLIGSLFIDSFHDEDAFDEYDKRVIEAISKVSSIYIYLKISLNKLDDTYLGMIRALAEAVELKDKYTKGHSDRVAKYSLRLADALGFSEKDKRCLKEAALLHDIGKIGILDNILNKPDKLSEKEFDIIKKHTIYGGRILTKVSNLIKVADIVKHHHERWDGKGYPDGLKGNEIPIESRIIAIFDAFDTILTARAYKKALSFETAIKEIKDNSGTQFDPELVDVFLNNVSEEWIERG